MTVTLVSLTEIPVKFSVRRGPWRRLRRRSWEWEGKGKVFLPYSEDFFSRDWHVNAEKKKAFAKQMVLPSERLSLNSFISFTKPFPSFFLSLKRKKNPSKD